MLTCDVCGKLHPPGTATCDVCGAGLVAWPYLANSDLGAELGLDRLPPDSALGRELVAPLRALSEALCPFCQGTNRPGATFCTHCGHSLVTSPPGQPAGEVVGHLAPGALLQARYRIIRRVAQGGMGAVYEAHDEQTPGQRLALKEMVQTSVAPEERTQTLKDFMREATLLATLQHPNLPAFQGIFSEDGKHYLIMEFIQGQTLEHVVSNSASFLPETRVMTWAAQVCDVLHYLHSQDPPIIYRDTKPGNIMLLDGSDGVKLIDFGIARFHRRGQAGESAAFGTAGYAPPEQYGNGQTDQRSDVYALGATLHHLLSGHDPVQNPFHWRPIRSFNPHVSRRVDQAVMRALELDPTLRFESIDAFARALGMQPVQVPEAVPEAVPVPALPASARVAPGPLPVSADDLRHPLLEGTPRNGHRPQAPTAGDLAAVPVLPAVPVVPPPADGPQLVLSDTVLDLGVAGRKTRRGRKVNLLNTGAGQLKGIVQVTQPWLAVSAVQFQGNVGELQVSTRPGLELGRLQWPVPSMWAWARARMREAVWRWLFLAGLVVAALAAGSAGMSPVSGVVGTLIALAVVMGAFQGWLLLVARHVRWLVPASRVNRGQVVVESNGGRQQLEVQVVARPSPVRRLLAWSFLTALLVGELLAMAAGLLALAALLSSS
ncbi:MAG TPA: serine/threonine-protein kinase [Chloroflexia bacterium]|nr:serine/threonine-protein kinase [Chloroflexia bacterium]